VSAAPVRESGTGWYLYGVVPAGAAAPPVTAVDPEHEVMAIVQGDVAGIVSEVSLAEFDEAALPERLGDAAWLEQKIRSHEGVLDAALARAPVVPCRFCTVYRDEAHLRRFLAEQGDSLAEALVRLDGCVELGVKAFQAIPASKAPRAETGRAYLEARRDEQRAREELGRTRATIAARLHESLLAVAEDGVVLDPQSRDISGRTGEMVFNGAYLVVDRERFETALAAAARKNAGAFQLELTGPWPPYNFVPEQLGRS
jgi:hypothetical protein